MAIKEVMELGAKRAELRAELERVTEALERKVVEASKRAEDSEANIARAARVDRMTVRRWLGKPGQWSKINSGEKA